jgi:hypothetical protein
VYHLAEGKDKSQRFFDEDLEEHQPFPTLHQALDCIDPHVGFNIEVKWTMQLKVYLAILVGSRSCFYSAVKIRVTITGYISVRTLKTQRRMLWKVITIQNPLIIE